MSHPSAKATSSIIILLKISAICLLLGRAWQHFFWTTPYAVILPLESGQQIKYFNTAIGFYLLFGAVLSIFFKGKRNWQFLYLYGVLLIISFLSVSYWVTKSYRINQLFEYAIQVGVVWMLIKVYDKPINWPSFRQVLKILIAFTFTAHGLYALGFPYATPAGFIEMTVKILQIDEVSASWFLKLFGLLDILLSIGLFFKPTAKAALIYATFWGLATAFARTLAYYDSLSPLGSLHRWFYESLQRMPHAIFPFLLLICCGYYFKSKSKQLNSSAL